jgi:hypothetical protein
VNQVPVSVRIVLDSECPATKRTRLWALLLIGIVEPMILAGFYYIAFTPDWENFTILGVSMAWFFGAVLFELCGLWRGTWTLDDERVVFQPLHGPERALEWSRIDRVLWQQGAIAQLKGGATTIKLSWYRFTRTEREVAFHFVESRLSAQFDLEPLPPAPPPKRSEPRVELTYEQRRAVVIAIGSLLLAIGVSMAAIFLAPWPTVESFARILAFLLLSLLALEALCVALFVRAEKERLRPWREALHRMHPAWPWRLPRYKSFLSSGKTPAEPALADWSA